MSAEKTVESIECVEIFYVTGHNDSHDIRCGGPELLGPYAIVAKEDKDMFLNALEEYLERTGKKKRVLKILVQSVGLREVGRVKRGEDQIKWFCEYLDNESNW